MKHKQSLIVLAILFFILLGTAGTYLYWTDPLIQSPIDLNLGTYAPPEIPKEENASVLIAETTLNVPDSPGFNGLMTEDFLLNIADYDQSKLGRLETWHRQHQFVFTTIDQALKRPHASARHIFDFSGKNHYVSKMLSNLIKYQRLQKALWLRVIHEFHSGEVDQAYEHIAEMFRFARFTIEEHPAGSHFMIGCALTNMPSRALNQLMLLQKPKQAQRDANIEEVMRFDLIRYFEHSQRYSFALLAHTKHTPPPTEDAVIPIVGSLLKQYSIIQLRRETQRNIMLNIEMIQKYPDISQEAIQHLHKNYFEPLFGAMAYLNLIQLSIDFIDYHEANGHYPQTIAELEPSNPDSLIDPFNSKPFHYQRKDGKQILYSIYINLQDDQGQPSIIYNPDTGTYTYENLDLVWELPQ